MCQHPHLDGKIAVCLMWTAIQIPFQCKKQFSHGYSHAFEKRKNIYPTHPLTDPKDQLIVILQSSR